MQAGEHTHRSKAYSRLGKLLDTLARGRDVRGPYYIARNVERATGLKVSGQAVSKYLYGEYSPKREFIKAFTDAFELTSYERAELAWAYTYSFESCNQNLHVADAVMGGQWPLRLEGVASQSATETAMEIHNGMDS